MVRISRSGGSSSAGSSADDAKWVELSREMLMEIFFALAGPIVGFDDAGHEVAAHHVAGGEADRLDAAHAGQQPHRLLETRALTRRQIDLTGIAGHRHLRAFT